MEYTFRDKNYKLSKFKTFLTNQLKSEPIEIVINFLIEFIQQNNFEFDDLLSILSRYVDYSKRAGIENAILFEFVENEINKLSEFINDANILPISKVYYQIKSNYALHFIEQNLEILPNNKNKVSVLLFKVDILRKKAKLDEALSILSDCFNQSYELDLYDSLELKRTIFEKMALISDLENNSDAAINFYIYYCAFQAGLEFLRFPYLNEYRTFRVPYSIVENPEQEIIQVDRHLKEKNMNIKLFNTFLQDLYRIEIPKAFKLENINIDSFTVSGIDVKELTYYTYYIPSLSVKELVLTIEFLTSQKIKNFKN